MALPARDRVNQMPGEKFEANANGLPDTRVLRTMRSRRAGTAVADLAPLQGLTGLQTPSLDNTAVTDLAPGQAHQRTADISGL